MTQLSRPVKVVSLDCKRGWCILLLPDGSLQLDMGITGVMFASGEFRAFADMLAQARAAPGGEEVLAVGGTHRHILFYEIHQTVVITFGQAIVRLCPPDFEAFVQMCEHARAELETPPFGFCKPMRQPLLEQFLN
jgi:hypothetical protein